MEDEDIVDESVSVDAISSKNSYVSDSVKDTQSNTCELDEMQVEVLIENVTVVEDPNSPMVNGIDSNKEFETNTEFESGAAVVQWYQKVGEENTMGDDSSGGSFVSDSVKDRQLNTCELDEMKVENVTKDVSVVEHTEAFAVNQVDMTKEFETDMVFDSREAVIKWCQEVGKRNNMVIVISNSRNTSIGKGSSVTLLCERSGVSKSHKKKGYQPKSNGKRKKPETKKCGCPFKLKSTCRATDIWTLTVKCGIHNHDVPNTPTGHVGPVRLEKEEEEIIANLTSIGVPPREVLAALKKKNKDNNATIKTIYNVRSKLRRCDTEESTYMQQLMQVLAAHNYTEYNRKDHNSNEVRDIFWTHPEAILLAQCFPSVVIINCSCKTNRVKMPLFHAVGMTSTAKSFTVALALLKENTEEHYTWALTQLKRIYRPSHYPSVFVTDGEFALTNGINTIFPGVSNVICTLHIDKSIHDHCKKSFDNEQTLEEFFADWKNLRNTEVDNEYSNALTIFVSKWASTYGLCISYICETWLVQKEKFVRAWTNNIKHYGNTTTKIFESEHAKVKVWLGTSRDTYVTCCERMHQMFLDEHVEIRASFEKNLNSSKQGHHITLFKDLQNHIAVKAMDFMVEEMKRSGGVGIDPVSCRCILWKTHGLPCAHELVQYAKEGKPIPLSAIDPHWKQLSFVLVVEKTDDFDLLPELQLLRQKWVEASEEERKSLVQKLNDIVTCSS